MKVHNPAPTPEVVDGGRLIDGQSTVDVPDGPRLRQAIDAGRLLDVAAAQGEQPDTIPADSAPADTPAPDEDTAAPDAVPSAEHATTSRKGRSSGQEG